MTDRLSPTGVYNRLSPTGVYKDSIFTESVKSDFRLRLPVEPISNPAIICGLTSSVILAIGIVQCSEEQRCLLCAIPIVAVLTYSCLLCFSSQERLTIAEFKERLKHCNDNPYKKLCVLAAYRQLSQKIENLPAALDITRCFQGLLEPNTFDRSKLVEEAAIGPLEGRMQSNTSRLAYVYNLGHIPANDLERLVAYLHDDSVELAMTAVWGGGRGKKLQKSGHDVPTLHNILDLSGVKDPRLECVRNEFVNYMQSEGYSVAYYMKSSFALAFFPHFDSAYGPVENLEEMHIDSAQKGAVTISSVMSHKLQAGIKFRSASKDQVVSRDGHVVVFPSDAEHGSDFVGLWKEKDLEKYEGLIKKLGMFQKQNNIQNVLLCEKEIRAFNAERGCRAISKMQLYLNKKKGPFYEAPSHEERAALLAGFNDYLQNKIVSSRACQ
jgi:hypothetical protein